jgi:hypothetical protein
MYQLADAIYSGECVATLCQNSIVTVDLEMARKSRIADHIHHSLIVETIQCHLDHSTMYSLEKNPSH